MPRASLKDAVGPFDLMSKDELIDTLVLLEIALRMNSGHREVLEACRDKGPLWDGDVPSKSHRDDLCAWGAIAKVWVNGEEGFNACTYRGHHLAKIAASAREIILRSDPTRQLRTDRIAAGQIAGGGPIEAAPRPAPVVAPAHTPVG